MPGIWSFEPERLFPQEIWEKIFQHVTGEDELARLQRTCIFFKRILQSRCTSFLFTQSIALIHTDMSPSANLACRLVNRFWKDVIDTMTKKQMIIEPVQSSSSPVSSSLPRHSVVITPSSSRIDHYLNAVQNSYRFGNSSRICQKIGEFLQLIDVTHSAEHNPFIGNSLTLEVADPCNPQMNIALLGIFCAGLQRLLAKYGSHLNSITIILPISLHIDDMRNLSVTICTLLDGCVPNLGSFSANGLIPTFITQHNWLHTYEIRLASDNVPGNVPPNQVDNIRTCLHSVPVHGIRRMTNTWNVWHDWQLCERNWHALTELYLTDVGVSLNVESIVNAHIPNLVKIGVRPRRNYGSGPTEYGKVVGILGGLSGRSKLNSFVTVGGFALVENAGEEYHASSSSLVAHIKHLEIVEELYYSYDGPAKYAFVGQFQSIESLQLSWVRSGSVWEDAWLYGGGDDILDETDLSRILPGRVQVLKARIWNILPKLERLTVNHTEYVKKKE